MHSYSVQLLWHVCHAILTSSRRTIILEGRKCSHCALDSEEMQHGALGSASLREDLSQIFLSRPNSRQCWGSAMCRALVRAALRLCFLPPPFSSLSSTCDFSPWGRDRSACRAQMPTVCAVNEAKFMSSESCPVKGHGCLRWSQTVLYICACHLHCGFFSSLIHKTKGVATYLEWKGISCDAVKTPQRLVNITGKGGGT